MQNETQVPVKKVTAKRKPKPKSKAQKLRDIGAKKRQTAAETRQRCNELYDAGWTQIRIAEELNVGPHTICRWLTKSGRSEEKAKRKAAAVEESAPEPFAKNLEDVASETVLDSRMSARDEEQQALLEVAENQSSPSDKYQAYVAASAIKMLRDNLMNVRGPRTVRELSELDQLIRRNLGLNPKGGSSNGGGLSIDISILNNAKAANGGSSVIVEAEEV